MPRKKVDVDMQQLQNLLGLHISITEIADILSVSRPTLYKILRENDLAPHDFSSITNVQLDNLIREVKRHHPSAGEVMVAGHLRSRGIRVQRARLRQSLHRVDPIGINERRLHTIRRRQYTAPSPNYIWHIDGTHKLIKWKMVVHAGIDGFSRLVTFCHCSSNNKSETVLQLFLEAVGKYGLPLKVRSDYGVENVKVWDHMLRSTVNTNSVIVGSSVHNQRIERLHRDINTQVINKFYNEFIDLENGNMLDSSNETDLFFLHKVYLHQINACLKEFVSATNNHSLSTEGNKTPLQLFQLNYRLLQLQSLNPSGTIDLDDIHARSTNNVQVPRISNPFNNPTTHLIDTFISGHQHLEPKDLYEAVIKFTFDCESPVNNQ